MRLILLGIGFVIILAILWDGLRRKKKQTQQVKSINTVIDDSSDEPQKHFTEDEADLEQATASLSKKKKTVPPTAVQEAAVEEVVEPAPVKPEPVVVSEPTPTPVMEQVTPEPEPQIAPEAPAILNPESSVETETETTTAAVSSEPKKPLDIVMFTVSTEDDKPFGGFSLLQVLLARGFRFADDKLFYYHENNESQGRKLFGLAAATNDGLFDLSNMARFICRGLILFMHPKDQTDAVNVFNTMIDTAEELSEDLNGQLTIEHDLPWNEAGLNELRQRLTVS